LAKVLLVNGPGEGHINPTIGLVQELKRRGEEVVYLLPAGMHEKIEALGVDVRTYELEMLMKSPEDARHFLDMAGNLLNMVDAILSTVRAWKAAGETFDYLIHDSMFGCGSLVARELNVPNISSCSTFAMTKDDWMTMSQRIMELQQAQQGAHGLAPYTPAELAEKRRACDEQLARINETYGLEIREVNELMFQSAMMTLVYTSRAFQPQAERFDAGQYHFVGPSIKERPEQVEFPWERLEGKPVVFVSMGTILYKTVDLFKTVIAALKDLDATVVLSIGRRLSAADLGEIPPHFIVANYVPQLELLQKTDVFITHGGMNSTSEGLYYGVPLVVIPQTSDQPMVGKQVADLGAGVMLDKHTLTADQLRRAVRKLLADSSYRDKAHRLGDSFRSAGGYVAAVDAVEAFKKKVLQNH